MKKVLIGLIFVLFAFGYGYWLEQQDIKKGVAILQNVDFANIENVDQLIIKQYPEELSYFSFKDEEIEEVIKGFNSLTLKEVNSFKKSASYVNIQLQQEGGIGEYFHYNLYENGFIEYIEGSLVGFKTRYYEADAEQLNNLKVAILKDKQFDAS